MTTDRELRDLLNDEAGAPPRNTAPWDDIVRRGRHHRRVTRVRTGIAAGGLAALAVIALTDLGRENDQGVVANDPDDTATTTTTASSVTVPTSVDQVVARVSGVFVTIAISPSDPPTGFDPCTEQQPVVEETTDDVRVAVVTADPGSNARWAGCQASPFSGWATIELTDPLGTRRLIDAHDGLEVPVIDNVNLLFPTGVPAPFDITRWDESSGTGGLTDRTFSWSQDDLFLSVRNAPLEQPVPFGDNPGDGCSGDPITIRGAEGRVCQSGKGSFVLLWDEDGWRRQIEMGPLSDNVSPFTLEDAMAVADSLEPLG
jgi:hypothetical protein